MSEAKKKVLALIEKRQKKNEAYKTKTAQRLGPNGIVLQFIEAMDKVLNESKGPLDFELGLEREAGFLLSRLRCIDPNVDCAITWNREDIINNWQELCVEGVLIQWSKWYLGKNPFSDAEKYIDVGTLFLDGFIQ